MLRARARSIPDKATRPIHQRVVTLFLEMLPSFVIWVLLKMEPIPEYHIFPSLFPFLVEHYSKSTSNCRQAKYESPWKRTLYPSSNKWYSFRYLYVYRTSVVLAVNHIWFWQYKYRKQIFVGPRSSNCFVVTNSLSRGLYFPLRISYMREGKNQFPRSFSENLCCLANCRTDVSQRRDLVLRLASCVINMFTRKKIIFHFCLLRILFSVYRHDSIILERQNNCVYETKTQI